VEFFEILAECAIAAGGFSAIHAAMRGSEGPRGSMRAWTTVGSSMAAFVSSLIPILLESSGLSPEALWRTASLLAGAICTAYAFSAIYIDRRLVRAGHPAQVPGVLRLAQSMHVAAALILLANGMGLFAPPGQFLCALGVMLNLVSGVVGLLVSFWLQVAAHIEPRTPD
jgi:hypothetical protein